MATNLTSAPSTSAVASGSNAPMDLNREEDIVLREILTQGVLTGSISKHKNFQEELQYAELQRELLGDLPELTNKALKRLNRLLSTFPSYSAPHRLVRSAQASISAVHAAVLAFVESLASQEHQARIAVAVMRDLAAKQEAKQQKERERRARSARQRDHTQPSMMSHIVRGSLPVTPKVAPVTPATPYIPRASSAPAHQARGFRSSTPAAPRQPTQGKTAGDPIVVSSDSSETAVPAKKSKPRRSPRLEANVAASAAAENASGSSSPMSDAAQGCNLDGACSTTTSSASTPPSPSQIAPLSAFNFFKDIMGDAADAAIREVEILREQARISSLPSPTFPVRSELGEIKMEQNDAAEDAIDLTITRLMRHDE